METLVQHYTSARGTRGRWRTIASGPWDHTWPIFDQRVLTIRPREGLRLLEHESETSWRICLEYWRPTRAKLFGVL